MKRLGFTLVETMIVMALSVVMLGALGFLIYSFNSSTSYEQIAARSAESARSVMKEVESLAPVADHILVSHNFSGTIYTSSSSVLILEIPSIDASGSAIASTYDYAVFYVVGTRAYRLLVANAASKRVSGTKQLSDTVSSLSFSYPTADLLLADSVTISVQTSAQSRGKTSVDSRSEELYLRNFQ